MYKIHVQETLSLDAAKGLECTKCTNGAFSSCLRTLRYEWQHTDWGKRLELNILHTGNVFLIFPPVSQVLARLKQCTSGHTGNFRRPLVRALGRERGSEAQAEEKSQGFFSSVLLCPSHPAVPQ